MFEAANTLIENKLRDNWTETDIDLDNVDFNSVEGVEFIRLQTEWIDANTVAAGGGRDRGEGYINVSVYVPGNTGTERVTVLADLVAGLYNKWDTGALKFKVARIIRIGQRGTWYRLDVLVNFTYDECN